jgi:hypothetical protein
MRLRKTGTIAGVKAIGSGVLVEMLKPDEALGTKLYVGKDTQTPPQGFIIDIGPALKGEEWGIKIGDRVVLQGSFVPLPKFGDGSRDLGMVEAHAIKCVLLEEDE